MINVHNISFSSFRSWFTFLYGFVRFCGALLCGDLKGNMELNRYTLLFGLFCLFLRGRSLIMCITFGRSEVTLYFFGNIIPDGRQRRSQKLFRFGSFFYKGGSDFSPIQPLLLLLATPLMDVIYFQQKFQKKIIS